MTNSSKTELDGREIRLENYFIRNNFAKHELAKFLINNLSTRDYTRSKSHVTWPKVGGPWNLKNHWISPTWTLIGKSWKTHTAFFRNFNFQGKSWTDFWNIHHFFVSSYSGFVKYWSVSHGVTHTSEFFEYNFRLNVLFWRSFPAIGLCYAQKF